MSGIRSLKYKFDSPRLDTEQLFAFDRSVCGYFWKNSIFEAWKILYDVIAMFSSFFQNMKMTLISEKFSTFREAKIFTKKILITFIRADVVNFLIIISSKLVLTSDFYHFFLFSSVSWYKYLIFCRCFFFCLCKCCQLLLLLLLVRSDGNLIGINPIFDRFFLYLQFHHKWNLINSINSNFRNLFK